MLTVKRNPFEICLIKSWLVIALMFPAFSLSAQNPLIMNQYTADPTARVFGNKVYLYPSHDILATPGHGRADWFCMEDYHVFSSADLTQWTDHGVIVSQTKVPWADSTAYSMWAPDCIARNGKFYFYFPATAKAGTNGPRGFRVGVAIADKPEGPFAVMPEPIAGISGIDPNVFIDKDGQAYIYYAQNSNLFAAKLKDNMTELASPAQVIANLPAHGLKEGPYLFDRNGIYYLTFPHVANKIERLEYTMGKSPLGPFSNNGVIMDESTSGCWTNHHSIIQFKGQWYLFYHNDDLSPHFDKARSVRSDSLCFNADGTIRKAIPTLRGVGITSATGMIQIDRYSAISDHGVTVEFIDTANRMQGWKVNLSVNNAWVRYNSVGFSAKKVKYAIVNAESFAGGVIEIRLDKPDGKLLSKVNIAASVNWQLSKSALTQMPLGKHDLFIISKGQKPISVDWIRFE